MSDSYDDYEAEMQLAEVTREAAKAKQNFRTEAWITKDGRRIVIKDMDDKHLLNAYQHRQDSLLFREMVLRLFEAKLKERNT
tara:strand:+ start:169 stop:414 length:246 start_codon:yes stop_codon:yes gene_type:complete